MYGDVLLKVDLIDTTKGAEKIAQSDPKAFAGIDMHFPYAVSVVISSPYALSRRMTHRHMQPISFGEMIISSPFICINRRSWLCYIYTVYRKKLRFPQVASRSSSFLIIY
jgi:hypothetical protein